MSEFEIRVTELEEGGKNYEFPVDPAWLDRAIDDPELHAAPDAMGSVSFFASLSGTDVIVRGRIRTAVIAPCARCLADTRIEVDTELTGLFTKSPEASKKGRPAPIEVDLTPEELDQEVYSGDIVRLDDIVREQIVLEVPMQVHCRADCPGVPVPEHVRGPASLVDAPVVDGKPIDPRLAPLLSLKSAVPSAPKSLDKSDGLEKKSGASASDATPPGDDPPRPQKKRAS